VFGCLTVFTSFPVAIDDSPDAEWKGKENCNDKDELTSGWEILPIAQEPL
jgi:hypothetical protein